MSLDLIEAFTAQAERVAAVVHRARPDHGAEAVLDVLRGAGCRTVALAGAVPGRAALAGALGGAGLSEVPTADLWPNRRADGGVSSARLGVAETGSVLLHSTSEDRRVELCVDVHIVLLPKDALVSTLDQAFAELREISVGAPAYASLVSGPSRSADIERTLTIGVHGPRELHILLVPGDK